VLAVLYARQNLPLCSAVALELIRDDYSGDILTAFEELAEELLRRFLVPPSLHQDIEDIAVLIHRPPEIMALAIYREEDLVQVPLVAWPGAPVTQLVGILLAELPAPFADGLIRHDDPTDEQKFFHVSMAERKTEIQPDRVADDLPRESMMFIEIGRG
jgi:hypothetical protein